MTRNQRIQTSGMKPERAVLLLVVLAYQISAQSIFFPGRLLLSGQFLSSGFTRALTSQKCDASGAVNKLLLRRISRYQILNNTATRLFLSLDFCLCKKTDSSEINRDHFLKLKISIARHTPLSAQRSSFENQSWARLSKRLS